MLSSFYFFFFNDTATTEIYTLSLHDALPIFPRTSRNASSIDSASTNGVVSSNTAKTALLAAEYASMRGRTTTACGQSARRSEEHTSELQSLAYLVCRLLLEKKKKKNYTQHTR